MVPKLDGHKMIKTYNSAMKSIQLEANVMTKIIKIQDYLLENETLVPAEMLPKDFHNDLALEIQRLLSHVMNIEDNFSNHSLVSAALEGQVKELQVENQTLLKLLEVDDVDELPGNLTNGIASRSKQDVASQSIYWEREYGQLKDRIRHLEQLLTEKDDALKLSIQENALLINEILAK
jgi:hypothetical protein